MRFNLTYICIGAAMLSAAIVACVPVAGTETVKETPTIVGKTPIMVKKTPTLEKIPATVKETPTTEGKHSPWKLVWQDEFNSRYLDRNNWTADVDDWGGGNQELQYYTERNRNAYVENGLLNIVGRKEAYLTRDYTSARLNSTRSWTYGRFEVKAKLPEGQGIWPAIWLHSANEPYGPWPASGEIDIMEMLGHEPNVIYGSLHHGLPWPHDEEKQGKTILTSQGFHVFALEWDIDEIRWYVDDVHYFTVDSWYTSGGNYPAPFDKPFYIILNLAIGGTWPGDPDETTSFPQKLLIDYVRVYQK